MTGLLNLRDLLSGFEGGLNNELLVKLNLRVIKLLKQRPGSCATGPVQQIFESLLISAGCSEACAASGSQWLAE
jgi:hypothetical protein